MLYLDASGGIGDSTTSPLQVDLIQSLDRGRVSDPSDDTIRTTQLYALATNDIFLDVTGHDRVPDGTASRPDPFVVYVDNVQSTAGNVNLTLETSVRETGPPPVGGVEVQVYDNGPNVPSATGATILYDQTHSVHFLPDPTGSPTRSTRPATRRTPTLDREHVPLRASQGEPAGDHAGDLPEHHARLPGVRRGRPQPARPARVAPRDGRRRPRRVGKHHRPRRLRELRHRRVPRRTRATRARRTRRSPSSATPTSRTPPAPRGCSTPTSRAR